MTFLVNTQNNTDFAWEKRSTNGVPPGSLGTATIGPGLAAVPQRRGAYDRSRKLFLSWGFDGVDEGFVVVDATTLAQTAFYAVPSLSGVVVATSWDPVGDRYYAMVRSFAGGGPYYDYSLLSVAPDGTGLTTVAASAGKITGANVEVDICERPDGLAGVAALDFGTDGNSYVQLLAPDGSSTHRTMLPADANHGATSYTGVAIARPKAADYLAVMYFSGWAFSGGVIGGTWRAGAWIDQWTAPLPDVTFAPGGPYSPLGVVGGQPYMEGVLTPDPAAADVVWYGSNVHSYEDPSAHFLVFKVTAGVATSYNLGEWQQSGTRVLIAGGDAIPPLRQHPRDDGLRRNPPRGGPSGPASRQASLRRGPRGTYL